MYKPTNFDYCEFASLTGNDLALQIADHYEQKIASLERENKFESNRVESIEEQLYFARELIEELVNYAEQNLSKAKRHDITMILENSFFER